MANSVLRNHLSASTSMKGHVVIARQHSDAPYWIAGVLALNLGIAVLSVSVLDQRTVWPLYFGLSLYVIGFVFQHIEPGKLIPLFVLFGGGSMFVLLAADNADLLTPLILFLVPLVLAILQAPSQLSSRVHWRSVRYSLLVNSYAIIAGIITYTIISLLPRPSDLL